MKVALTVVEGANAGLAMEFLEPRGFIIGRAADADFQLPSNDPFVSRYHVHLEICPPSCRLKDLGTGGAGSTNPPHLNGQPVTDAELKDGDLLQLGYTQLKVSVSLDKTPEPELCVDSGEHRPEATGAPHVTSAHCTRCGMDLTRKANSDGRAHELANVASYCCENCVAQEDRVAGKAIHEYRVLRELGEGGMGSVLLVYHESTARIWALKQIKDLKNEQLVKRFEREIRLQRGLDHPNIVRFVDSGIDAQGAPFVVSEYVPGGELGAGVDAGLRLKPESAVSLICAVLTGLEYLHTRPDAIIHRDIKPQNILIDRNLMNARGRIATPLPVPKISDFGLAKCYGRAGGTRITKLRTAMGTLMYMPPEQVREAATVREPADVYAVGVMLYYLLTGRYTFNFPSPQEVKELEKQDADRLQEPKDILRMIMDLHRIRHPFHVILSERPTPIRTRDSTIPEKLAAVVDCAVKKDVAERFKSAAEFRQALLRAM